MVRSLPEIVVTEMSITDLVSALLINGCNDLFSEEDLNRIGHLMPDELSNLSKMDKAKVGINVLAKNYDLYQKGVVDAFLAFGYSRASHYGW